MVYCTLHCKNILWIPKRYSEAVSLRRAFYTIARRKGQQQKTKIFKTLHRKLMIEQHKPNKH